MNLMRLRSESEKPESAPALSGRGSGETSGNQDPPKFEDDEDPYAQVKEPETNNKKTERNEKEEQNANKSKTKKKKKRKQ